MVVGEEQQSQETGNDDESDHNLASQDTQQEDEPIDGLQRLFRVGDRLMIDDLCKVIAADIELYSW